MEKKASVVLKIKEARQLLLDRLHQVDANTNSIHAALVLFGESAGVPVGIAKKYASEFLDALAANKSLANCTASSLLGAFLSGIRLNLPLAPSTGMLYFVPFKNSCTLIISYKGLAVLANRRFPTLLFNAEMVLSGEAFKLVYGSSIQLHHEISPNRNRWKTSGEDGGKLVGVYAYARNISTGSLITATYLSFAEVEALRLRNASQAFKNANNKHTPWDTDYVAMAFAKAIKQMLRAAGLAEVELDGKVVDIDIDGNATEQPIDAESEVVETATSIGHKAAALLDNANCTREELEAMQSAYIKICGNDSWVASGLAQKFVNKIQTFNLQSDVSVTLIQPQPASFERKAAMYLLQIAEATTIERLGTIYAEALSAFDNSIELMNTHGLMKALGARKVEVKQKGGENA